MSVRIRHTKSESGRTHRLTVTVVHEGIGRTDETITTLRYKTTPAFDDQVQGDLIRKYWAEGGCVSPIGRLAQGGMATVDPELTKEESERGKPTPRAIAEACYHALGDPDSLTPDQFIGAIMTAVRLEREKV